MMLGISLFSFSCTRFAVLPKTSSYSRSMAKNTVLVIVDGMGFNYIKSTRIYRGQKPLNFERFTCSTKVSTCAADGADSQGRCLDGSTHVTDSAAAATAIATGIKVSNGVISKKISHAHQDIETILELAKAQSKSTGIIATKLFTDATPAAFVSHAGDREMTEEILSDMFGDAKPNLILGADNDLHRSIAKTSSAKYQFVHTAVDLKNLAEKCLSSDCPYVYGGFGQHDMIPGIYAKKSGLPLEITPADYFNEHGVPHLSEMTDAALKILSNNPSGFFLMVESSMPDMIGHYHSQIDENGQSPSAIAALIKEMLELENTVKVLEAFIASHPNTLVVLTADHETGGLMLDEDKTPCLGHENCLPIVRWTAEKYEPVKASAARHTGVDVPLYAIGEGAQRFCKDRINNTDIKGLVFAN